MSWGVRRRAGTPSSQPSRLPLRFRPLFGVGAAFLGCVPSHTERPHRVALGERYALVAINGEPLPYTPPQGDTPAFRVVADTFQVRADGQVQHVRWMRTVMLESWPCDVLRTMRADRAAGRSGGAAQAADTPPAPSDAACDGLRDEADSSSGRLVEHAGAQRITYTAAVGRPGDAALRWRGNLLELTYAESDDRFAYRRVR